MAEVITHPEMLVCTDESSKDKKNISRRWGYSCLGVCCYSQEPFIHGKWYLILPLLGIDGYLAYEVFEGAVTGEMFEKFLWEHVVSALNAPIMHPYPSLHSVLLLDNCPLHYGPVVQDIIGGEVGMSCLLGQFFHTYFSLGGKLMYLPQYLPDYNPIEQSFLSIKAWLQWNYNEDIHHITDAPKLGA
ncbi:hypothetical protein BS47DRAFT_1292183 [Hydnum rufescens UP504]|uniref:Tc1-like transposase DDE domain-containing protein n=1 Tax=Hydnum rufescens UP504 TaxID=1448309 RepID=A0A9P6B359_9AGAM|nr:hypothetical protein BS47DRAFT_1292183 [Hydnum rufescens UP504]